MTSTFVTRRPHNKVRTGCLTCKARRKKCDEAKPSCRRCVTAGFKCDGYANIIIAKPVNNPTRFKTNLVLPIARLEVESSTNSSNQSSPRRDISPSSIVSRSWQSPITSLDEDVYEKCTSRRDLAKAHQRKATSVKTAPLGELRLSLTRGPNALADLDRISDLEVHCYSYFRQRTVPRLATYFENFLWRIDLHNAAISVHHPVLFKAVTALGAVHRRFCYGISREAFEYCAHAARLYKDAVESLENLKQSKMSIGDHQLVSACEALLAIFQGFQADTKASSRHIRSGVRAIVGPPLKLLHSESWYYESPTPPRIMCGMMYQLYCRATEIHGELPLTHTQYYTSLPPLKMPLIFASLIEMNTYLFNVLVGAWHDHRFVLDLSARRAFLEIYEDFLHVWTSTCMRTLQQGLVIEPRQYKAFNLLNLTHSAICVCIQGLLLTTDRPDMRPVPHLPVLGNGDDDFSEAAVELCEAVDYMYSIENADLSHVKQLFQRTLSKYPIFSFKQRSMFEELESDVDEIVNLWTIAKHVGEAEEAEITERLRDAIPPNAINADIADIWPDERVVLMRYFEPSYREGGFRCVQQCWSY